MIIIGYPGIGKSTLAGRESGCIDLESSDFKELFPVGQWVVPYCTMAENLAKQGFTVFVSSHAEVRAQFFMRKTPCVVLIYPALELEEEWYERVMKRSWHTRSDKDGRSYVRVCDHYKEDITALMEESRYFTAYVIESMDYILD